MLESLAMQDVTREKVPDFDDYRIGTTYHSRVGRRIRHGAKGNYHFYKLAPMYMIMAEEKPKDPTLIAREREFERELEEERKKRPPGSEIDVDQEVDRHISKWRNNLTNDELRRLFEQYYVEGHDCYCLALQPGVKEGVPLYKFLLPEYHTEESPEELTGEELDDSVDSDFEQFVVSLRGSCGNELMRKNKFVALIRRLRRIVDTYQLEKTLERNDCRELSNLCEELPKSKDVLSDLLQSMLQSLVDDLMRNEVILRCEYCGGFFRVTRGNKKFCSLKTDGKDCGTKARRESDYQKHIDERRAQAREYARKRRAASKKLGARK